MPSLKASSRLDFGVIPNGDAFSVPQHPEQPVGPRVIPVRGPAMGNLRAALSTVTVHAMAGAEPADGAPFTLRLLFEVYVTSGSNIGARFVQGIVCSGRALQCRCDTKSDCKSCH